MTKMHRKLLSSVLALSMSGLPGLAQTFAPVFVSAAETAGDEDVLSLQEKAVPRYSSIRVAWQPEEGKTYTVTRIDTINGEKNPVVVAQDVTSGEVIDENAGTEKIRKYIITDSDGKSTAQFSNSVKTGLKAMAAAAEVYWSDETIGTESRKIFDGEGGVTLEGAYEKMKDITSGTIIIRAASNSPNTGSTYQKRAILTFQNEGDNSKWIGMRSMNANSQNASGMEMNGFSMAGAHAALYSQDANITTALTFNDTGEDAGVYMAEDGSNSWYVANNAAFKDTCIYVGGSQYYPLLQYAKPYDTLVAGTNWKGTIDYILITSEVLSVEETKALTAADVIQPTDPEPDYAETMDLAVETSWSTTTLSWNQTSSKDDFRVYRKKAGGEYELMPADPTNQAGSVTWSHPSDPEFKWTYKVEVLDQDGNVDDSSLEVTIPSLMNAPVSKTWDKEERVIAENQVSSVLSEDADEKAAQIEYLKSATKGSLVITFKATAATAGKELLTAWNDARPANFPNNLTSGFVFGWGLDSQYRFDLTKTRANNGIVNTGDSQWHTFVFSNGQAADVAKPLENNCLRTVVDDSAHAGFTVNANNATWFSTLDNLSEVMIGDSENGFTGEISYVSISDDLLSTDETKAMANYLTRRAWDIERAELLDEYSSLKAADYTTESWQAYAQKRDAAKALSRDNSAQELSQAIAELKAAKNALKEADPSAALAASISSGWFVNTLSWTTEGTATISRRAAGSEDEFKPVGTSSTGTFTDSLPLKDTVARYEYKVTIDSHESDILTAANELESCAAYSRLENTVFDGNRVAELTTDADLINSLKSLDSGSYVFKFKGDLSAGASILQITSPGVQTTTIPTSGAISAGNMAALLRTDGNFRFGLGADTGFTVNAGVAANEWHRVVVTVEGDDSGGNCQVYVDGYNVAGWNGNTGFKGFLNRYPDMNHIYLGGVPGEDDSVLLGLVGEIEYAGLSSECFSYEEAIAITGGASRGAFSTMTDGGEDRTWVFTGGRMAEGSLQDISTARNYSGQFEEVIRWEQSANDVYKKQRYVTNTAKTGLSLSEIDSRWDNLIGRLAPKAAAIMLDGIEGMSDSEIGAAVESILSKNVNAGILTLFQIPPVANRADLLGIVEKYTDNMEDPSQARVIVHDWDVTTHPDRFNQDGSLNANGHLAISNDLTRWLLDSSSSITDAKLDKSLEDMAEVTNVKPAAAKTEDGAIEFTAEGEWTSYSITDPTGQSLKAALEDGKALLENLKENEEYSISFWNADDSARTLTLSGTVTAEGFEESSPAYTAAQQAIREKIASDKPLTWLFMGDSITHGAAHTYGYDSTPQLMEKYINDELGRVDDIVLNTGNSGATLENGNSTVENWQQRYKRYSSQADIVVMQLGTNDSGYSSPTVEKWKADLKARVQEIQKDGALVVLRVPNGEFTGGNQTRLNALFEAIREVANETGCALADHGAAWQAEYYIDSTVGMNTESRYDVENKAGGDWNANRQHPSWRGHLKTTQQLIEAMGLYDETKIIPNADYVIPGATTSQGSGSLSASYIKTQETLTFSIKNLETAAGKEYGRVTAVYTLNGKQYSKTFERTSSESLGDVSLNIPNEEGTGTLSLVCYDRANVKNAHTYSVKVVMPGDEPEALSLSGSGLWFSNELRWTDGAGFTVDVMRKPADADDSEWSVIATTEAGSYTDSFTLDTKAKEAYSYKLSYTKYDGSKLESDVITLQSGLESSITSIRLDGFDRVFDGNRAVDLVTSDDIRDTLRTLNEGSYVIRWKSDLNNESGFGAQQALFSAASGEGKNLTIPTYAKDSDGNPGGAAGAGIMGLLDDGRFRHQIHASEGWAMDAGLSNNNWHTLVISYKANSCQLVVDGVDITPSAIRSNAAFTSLTGLYPELTNLWIGGTQNGDEVAVGLSGQIAWAGITSEFFTVEQAIAISQQTDEPELPNKEPLQEAVTEAGEISENLDLYEDGDAKTAFAAALSEANAVLSDVNATQEEITAVLNKLNTAMSALVLKEPEVVIDYSLLQLVTDAVKALNAADYSTDLASLKALSLDKAELIDTSKDQQAVDKAAQDVNDKYLTIRLTPKASALNKLK